MEHNWLTRLSGGLPAKANRPPLVDHWLIVHDEPEDLIEQVTVGVDPSGCGDEVGIVACALLNDGRYAVQRR